MAECADTLYIVSNDELLASVDNGETWNALGPRPEGDPAELIVIDAADGPNVHNRVTMYLALSNRGVFRSTDAGKHWTPVNNGLTGRKIYKLAAIGNTVFCWYRQRALPTQIRHLGAIAHRCAPDYPRLGGL